MEGDNKIMVSIQCLVYNHEPFLRDCLDGFVKQKTNFRFEAIVHDDASTDNSPVIIREYADRYPDIIKPMFELENQYSKGDGTLEKKILPALCGKYVALCEGDDYWTDPDKLQKQFDAMEKHPELDMCSHSGAIINASTNELIKLHVVSKTQCILRLKDVLLGEGGYLLTNSLFYRTEIEYKIPPFREYMNYDYTLQIHGAMRGGILYLPENMSTYRLGVINSFSTSLKQSKDRQVEYVKKKKKMLSIFDQYTDKAFHKVVEACFIQYDVLPTNLRKDNVRSLIKHRKGLFVFPLIRIIILLLRCLCPSVMLKLSHFRD